jgi:DNA-binding transcriptional LysR family regulator
MPVDPDLRLLRMFVVLVARGGFTRAAPALGVTQPALSQSIRRLETLLGVVLVDRSQGARNGGVHLTPAGLVFHREALGVLAAAERAIAQTRRAALARRVVVGFTTSAPRDMIGAVVAAGDAGGIEVVLEHVAWGAERERLADGEIDLLVAQLPRIDIEPAWTVIGLDERPRVVAVRHDHRLAASASVSLDDLAEEPVVDAASDRDYWLAVPRPDGSVPVVVGPPARNAEEMLAQVVAGRGLAFTSSSVAENSGSSGVAFVPVRDLSPVVVALVHRSEETDAAVLDLVDRVRTRSDTQTSALG